ncbi:MAG TPA: thioredoxin domain-containing protein [Steroidobacteraceae bacterium]|nr:thioredoxin domain-containing protein [Steroidobacteraceae bacterium]
MDASPPPDPAPGHTNALAHETSPYLRQHAHNPVDWHPWGEAAFELARATGRPVHLSIGYSACHWCHVLAHESFEDGTTARLLNQHFVNIKVDREERPDIDRIYQLAQQLLTRRSGGWPLTMFLTPDDRRPFFGGTYFPPEPRFGLPSFRQVLTRVAEYYREHQAQLREQSAALVQVFEQLSPPAAPADTVLTAAPIADARQAAAAAFDRHFGGFGPAPKFPHPQLLARLLRDWHATSGGAVPDLHALFMATLTLRRMGEGGLNDQLGGGFFRYSVDAEWMIPHFEKMLYDNGQLLAVYAEAAIATGDPFYARIAAHTADWAVREMRADGGGFYSSLDADSQGGEGRFYVWSREQVQELLTGAEYAAFAPRFGLDAAPNFEQAWHHLYVRRALDDVGGTLGLSAQAAGAAVDAARARLFAARGARARPGRDEKFLTAWNALMIRGLAVAALALDRDEFAAAAGDALAFLRARLWRNGRLLATATLERAQLHAYLDDYAFLADAVLELQQVRFVPAELAFARELVEVLLAHFEDARDGGFFFTADDHEQLIHRSKSFADEATPAGNAVAARVLLRLGHLLGETRYLSAAGRTLRAAWPSLAQQPLGHPGMLTALEEWLQPPQMVILRGAPAQIDAWRRQLARVYAPRRMVLAVAADAQDLPEALAARAPRGAAVAYVCEAHTCGPPLSSLPELIAALRR